jgi:LPS sulfotransferase NodH
MSVKYIIISEGRAGSTYLRTCLKSVPGVVVDGELGTNSGFNVSRFLKLSSSVLTQNPNFALKIFLEKQLKKIYKFRYLRVFTQLAYLHKIFKLKTAPDIKAIGFCIKFCHIANPTVFKKYIEHYQIRIIYLTRENVIKHAMSNINVARLLEKHGLWNSLKTTQLLPPLQLSSKELETEVKLRLKREANLRDYINALDTPVLRLPYELLLKDNDKYFEHIFAFLNIPPTHVMSNLAKTTSDNLRDAILNYDEVRTHFKDTEFYEMFN